MLHSPNLHQLFVWAWSTDVTSVVEVLDLYFTLEWPCWGRNGKVYITVPRCATFTKLTTTVLSWHDLLMLMVFSAPEPKAQVHYCDHALSVVRRPSVRPSVRLSVCPSLTFHIFDFSETAEQNSTKLHRKQGLDVLYQVCVFRADLKNKMAALASDWLRHFRLLLWNRWTEFNETWQEARS